MEDVFKEKNILLWKLESKAYKTFKKQQQLTADIVHMFRCIDFSLQFILPQIEIWEECMWKSAYWLSGYNY